MIKCGQPIEYYNEECIGYCVIVCGILVHFKRVILAPLFMNIIEIVGSVAESHIFMHVRYTFQYLAANNIFYQFVISLNTDGIIDISALLFVTTNGADYMKHYLKLSNLTEDILGEQLKVGLEQYLALEFTKGGQTVSKAFVRFLPWLYNSSASIQHEAKTCR
ncbi:unnamed protein product [Rotaria sp. Silwood1]|nr:unnamed protein product [Rotaria sp. Silwood1]CAF1530109.1 unnamed protein product [Rotaria sp. Silwood1]